MIALCQPCLGVISGPGSCPWALAAARHPETPLAWCGSRAGTPVPVHHLLPDERHSLGGLRHLLGNEEEEDGLGQEDVDGDGAFLPTRCQGRGEGRGWHGAVVWALPFFGQALPQDFNCEVPQNSPPPPSNITGVHGTDGPQAQRDNEPFLACPYPPCTSLCPSWA